jgi:tetratricopeptide (TPR) repeat protein
MPKLFVIMPFGVKEAPHLPGARLDFDEVYRSIIRRAGEEAGWNVSRIDEFAESGNISDQYLREILQADMVLADISTPNGNVFYELGIRQAISSGGTILFAHEGTTLPFDLSTQRVLFYDSSGDQGAMRARDKIKEFLQTGLGRPGDSPVRRFLDQIGATASPSVDLGAFERDLAARIDRARTVDQLIAVWMWARNLSPLPVAPLLGLAERLSDSLEWPTATEVLKAAVRQQPKDFEIHRQLGWYLAQMGAEHDEESLASFQRALELNPHDPETLGMMGGRLKRKGEYAEAAKFYSRAATVSPNSLYILVNQAAVKILEDPTKILEGVELYQKLVSRIGTNKASGADVWTELVLAEALFGTGNHAEATEHYRQATALATSPKSLDSAARQLEIFAKAGFRSESARSLVALLRNKFSDDSSSVSFQPSTAESATELTKPASRELPLIIHLSDLHFGSRDGGKTEMHRFYEGTNSQPLSRQIVEDLGSVADYASQRHRFHLIVSGDLTYTGIQAEFDQALTSLVAICEELSVAKERVHFVPGNHDVDWKQSIADPAKRLNNYIAFLIRFYGDDLFQQRFPKVEWPLTITKPPPRPDDLISFSVDENAGLVVVGMNSCVFENEQHHYGFIGENQLRLVKSQLQKAGPPREWVRIAVIHHHLHPFPELLTPRAAADVWLDLSTLRDSGLVERYLERLGFDMVLHGHKHKPSIRETRVRDAQPFEYEPRPLIVCGAGSVGVSEKELEHNVSNQYQVIDVRRIPRQPEAEFLQIDWRILPVEAGAEWLSQKKWKILG